MGITVKIERPGFATELVGRLAGGGCIALVLDDRSCRVAFPAAVDEREEWQELRFFLRAWEAGHGVRVKLTPDSLPPVHEADAYGVATRSTGFSIRPCS